MDDDRWEEGMPVLDRQSSDRAPAGASARSSEGSSRVSHGIAPPDRVPETRPTRLQKHYINLSAIALVAGAIAITAINAGVPLASPLVKLCVLVGAPIFVLTTADAAVRFYRSAWAWMPVDVGRGLFRLAWVAVALLGIGVAVGAASIVLTA